MTQTLIGIGFSVLAALIGAIWKGLNDKVAKQSSKTDEIEIAQEGLKLQANDLENKLVAMQEACIKNHRSDVGETQIRSIFKEELKEFEGRIEKQLTTTIKLSLFEEGYIKQPPNRKKRSNAEKT
jgi:hypothetical protein